MVGICQVTKSHHNHRGQKPTMVGFCHGGNVPISHDDDDDDVGGKLTVGRHQGRFRIPERSAPLLTRL